MAIARRLERTRPDGSKYLSEKYYCRFRDPSSPTGWRLKKGYADQKASEQLAARLEREAAQRAEGIEPPKSKADLYPDVYKQLAEWEKKLAARNIGGDYLKCTVGRVRKVLDGIGARFAIDLTADDVSSWLNERHLEWLKAVRAGKAKRPPRGPKKLVKAKNGQRRWKRPKPGTDYLATAERMSTGTYKGYVTAVRMFCKYLKQPMADLKPLPENEEGQRRRRVIEPEEFGRLIAATRASAWSFRGLDGPHRAALYCFSAYTGLRAHELSKLEFDRRAKVVRVQAGYSKNRTYSKVPIPDALWTLTADWLATRPANLPLFPGTFWKKGADALKVDLAAAGIPYETADGYFDFHALRGYYATSLIEAGVPLPDVQKLARLKTASVLTKHYAKANERRLAQQAAKLQPPPIPSSLRLHEPQADAC